MLLTFRNSSPWHFSKTNFIVLFLFWLVFTWFITRNISVRTQQKAKLKARRQASANWQLCLLKELNEIYTGVAQERMCARTKETSKKLKWNKNTTWAIFYSSGIYNVQQVVKVKYGLIGWTSCQWKQPKCCLPIYSPTWYFRKASTVSRVSLCLW